MSMGTISTVTAVQTYVFRNCPCVKLTQYLALQDFILSILRASPSIRDTKSYLASFGPRKTPPAMPSLPSPPAEPLVDNEPSDAESVTAELPAPSPIVSSILDPIYRRTALVK